jgi:murein DD-endopeptidase MepM/ murein hydrolase activator NlpD
MYQRPEAYAQYGMGGHNGTDLAAAEGTPVLCIADGVVAYVDYDDEGYGHYCRVYHAQLAIHSFYAHMREAATVAVRQKVTAGQSLGYVGSSGNSTAPHLHLEIRLAKPDGSYDEACAPMPKGRVDPETWFAMHDVKL